MDAVHAYEDARRASIDADNAVMAVMMASEVLRAASEKDRLVAQEAFDATLEAFNKAHLKAVEASTHAAIVWRSIKCLPDGVSF